MRVGKGCWQGPHTLPQRCIERLLRNGEVAARRGLVLRDFQLIVASPTETAEPYASSSLPLKPATSSLPPSLPLAQTSFAAYASCMCSACGYPAAPGHWTEAGAANMGDRLRARFRRAQILQRVLSAYGLQAHDGGLVPGIQLSTRTGEQAIVRDLAEVWIAAERMSGRTVDPLDPCFVG